MFGHIVFSIALGEDDEICGNVAVPSYEPAGSNEWATEGEVWDIDQTREYSTYDPKTAKKDQPVIR